MSLSEEEAKEMWCPMMQRSSVGNRCIASYCIMWRWANRNEMVSPEYWKGYCGLAGKPE